MLGGDNRLIRLQLTVAAVLAGSHVVCFGAAVAANLRPADSHGLAQAARTSDLVASAADGRRLGSDARGDAAVGGFSTAAATGRDSHAPPPRLPQHSGRRRESYAGHKSAGAPSHRRRFIIKSYRPKKTLPCPSGTTMNAHRKCVVEFKLDQDV